MNKTALNESVTVLNTILGLLFATVPSGSSSSQLLADVGSLQATAADQINAGTAMAALSTCFADATDAGATLARMSDARNSISQIVTVSVSASSIADAAVIYALAQEALIIGATAYTARDMVEQVLAQMAGEFDSAILAAADRNDSDTYQALLALAGSVTQYLVTTEQPLPFLTTYSFGTPVPSLVLAQRLYADPSRADELVAQNHTINPCFMQATGVCLSS